MMKIDVAIAAFLSRNLKETVKRHPKKNVCTKHKSKFSFNYVAVTNKCHNQTGLNINPIWQLADLSAHIPSARNL